MIESELCKGLFTKERIVLLSLVRWFFFLFSPLLSIGLVNTMVILQCRRRKTALQLQSVCVWGGWGGEEWTLQQTRLPSAPIQISKSVGRAEFFLLCGHCCRTWLMESGWPASQSSLKYLTRAVRFDNMKTDRLAPGSQHLYQVLECLRVQTEADWQKTEGWDSALHEESGNTWKLQLLTGQLKERHLVLFWNKLRQTGCLTGSQLLRYCIAEWGGVFGNSLLQLCVKLIHDYRDRGLI